MRGWLHARHGRLEVSRLGFRLSAFDQPTRVIDLAHPLSRDVRTSPSHVGFQLALKRRHGDSYRADGGSGASEVIVTCLHTGTHIDALSHASLDGKLHGGIDAYKAQLGGNGFTQLGAETNPGPNQLAIPRSTPATTSLMIPATPSRSRTAQTAATSPKRWCALRTGTPPAPAPVTLAITSPA